MPVGHLDRLKPVGEQMNGQLAVPGPAHAVLAVLGAAGGTGWLHWLWLAQQVVEHPEVQLAAQQVGRASTGAATAAMQWVSEGQAEVGDTVDRQVNLVWRPFILRGQPFPSLAHDAVVVVEHHRFFRHDSGPPAFLVRNLE